MIPMTFWGISSAIRRPNPGSGASVGQHIFTQSFVYLLCVALLCLIAAVTYALARQEAASRQTVMNSLEVMEPPIVREAWQINEIGMNTILQSLASDPRIRAVRYHDENMDQTAVSQDQQDDPAIWLQCDEVILRDLSGRLFQQAALPSGEVVLCYRSSFTLSKVASTLLEAGIPILLFVLLGAAGPAFFAKKIVVDPVRRLTGYLREGPWLPEGDLLRGDRYQGDEIDQLYHELNARTHSIRLERDVSRRTFAFLVDGVAICDSSFLVQRCNSALTDLLGDEESQVIGKDIRSLLPCEAFERSDVFTEYELPDGRSVEICHRVVHGEGLPSLVIVVARDRTEQKRLERDRLQSQKMVALGTFSGGVAHDFNNLLSVISGASELLDPNISSTSEHTKLLQEIRAATRHGQNLTRQLLAYARRSDLKRENIHLPSLIEAIASMARRMIGTLYPLTVRITTDAVLRTDHSALETSILNLILNARDALAPGGEITLEIRDYSKDGDTDMVEIAVCNGGPPIPDRVLQRMTEPFFTTKPAGKGTGLGLSMVSGFARQEGGEIRVTSDVKQGTRISLIMPVAAQPADEITPVADSPAQKASQISTSSTLCHKILLIEDLDSVRNMTTLMLQRLGHHVDAVSGIYELEELTKERPHDWDIVLCDYALEAHTALDVITHLKGIGMNVPVIIMSGYLSVEVSKELEREGVSTMLTKPVPLAQLQEVLAAQPKKTEAICVVGAGL